MQPLNPFLAAFFKPGNPVIAQCAPVHHHILLVPTTEFFLTSRETESAVSPSEFVQSEDFLGSHVLRIPGGATTAGGKDAGLGNLRELRGKARQYNTLNGRNVVIKDAFIYTNKGFRSLAQAQLLNDFIWYSDTLEPRQWLIYYISRPLVGNWEEVKIPKAVFTPGMAKRKLAEAKQASAVENGEPSLPKKKEIKSFQDLLNNFPIIARQMQPGLEKLFREFTIVFERPLPPPPSASHIPDPAPDGPIATAMKKVRSNSVSHVRDSDAGLNGSTASRLTENFFAEDDEDVMRASSETAVTTAIDIFQNVDKQQLSMLGATTELTGPVVEHLIERYVSENVHNMLWVRLAAMHRHEDLELEAKIRHMEYIDISQLGIAFEGGAKQKHELTMRLERAIDEFRKMTDAVCPQDMMELLLSTMKAVTKIAEQPRPDVEAGSSAEKAPITINADTLVSFLLFVVIRAGVKNLQARLLYIRHFIFIDDVDSGEMGYALSTFEAVLQYLLRDSSSLRRASHRNKVLWDATARGDLGELRRVMDPDSDAIDDDEGDVRHVESRASSRTPSVSWSLANGSSRRSSTAYTVSETYSRGSGLSHVFPFQNQASSDLAPFKRIKKVAMDTRSLSSGSEYSFHSMAESLGTVGSGIEGDTSVERLVQTQDSFGESVLMMAIQHEQPESLRFLLSLEHYFPVELVLEDVNHQGTTLLSAAVQLGHTEIIDMILDFVKSSTNNKKITQYLARQDINGRSVAHYLFHAPYLITRIGRLLPWRQRDKNGLTPLLSLCRSYDHPHYHSMVEAGLEAARDAQGDGLPLHLDEHVDSKGNTLLHIVHDPLLIMKILQQCDVDVNATNEKKFTALMVSSKYGRFEMVRALYMDPRVDIAAKELRGLTAVELAKDDDVRNKMDDLTLFAMPSGEDARVTGVVRSFFVEDATIRLVLKSGAPSDGSSFTVTTCRRSLSDFERLAELLAMENPSSWIPSVSGQRSPFQIPSKPSRSVLRDIQSRTDWFLKILLIHPTFATHEMLWEFFLVPDLQADMMEQRSKLKAETRVEKIRDEMEPLEDMREVEQFVDHARDMVRSVNYSTKSVARRANCIVTANADTFDASTLLSKQVANLDFLPASHQAAFETYVRALQPMTSSPPQVFHTTFLALHSTITALLASLLKPPQLVAQIQNARKQVERSYNTLSRSTRWPLGLLDETRQRLNEEREGKAKEKQREVVELGKQLRYSQQTVAGELAGWQDMHEHMGRRAIKDFARGMLILEKNRLDGMMRALRKLQEKGPDVPLATRKMSDARAAEGAVDELASRELENLAHEAPVIRLSADNGAAEEMAPTAESSGKAPEEPVGSAPLPRSPSPPLPPLRTDDEAEPGEEAPARVDEEAPDGDAQEAGPKDGPME